MKGKRLLAQPKSEEPRRVRMGTPLTDSLQAQVVELQYGRMILHNLPGLKIKKEDLEPDHGVTWALRNIGRMINEDFDSIGEYVARFMDQFQDVHTCTVYVEPKKLLQHCSNDMLEHRLSVTRKNGGFAIDESGKGGPMEEDSLLRAQLYNAFECEQPTIFDYDVGIKIVFKDLNMDDCSGDVHPIDRGRGALAFMPLYYRDTEAPSGIVMLQGDLRCKGSGLEGFGKTYWTANAVMTGAAQISNQLTQKFDAITILTKTPDFIADFKESIRQLVEKRVEGLYLVLIDVDNFKELNEELGHPKADTILRRIADKIKTSIYSCDKAARVGGDEFAVILKGISSKEEALTIVERIREKVADIRTVFMNDGMEEEVKVTCSIGISDVGLIAQRVLASGRAPLNGDDIQKIFDAAVNCSDTCLFGAKRAGKNRTYLMPPGDFQMAASPPPA